MNEDILNESPAVSTEIVETVAVEEVPTFLEKDFADYTVTEGLLLLVFVILLLDFFHDLIRRWF